MSYAEQYLKFKAKAPYLPLNLNHAVTGNENCDFSDYAFRSKDCYMSFNIVEGERLINCFDTLFSKDCVDCSHVIRCEFSYECTDSERLYQCAYVSRSLDCRESYFLFSCLGLTNCFGCVELENKQYYIYNEPHTKEEYEARLKELLKQPPEVHLAKVEELLNGLPFYPMSNIDNQDCDFIDDTASCKDCSHSFYLAFSENCHYMFDSAYSKNVIDACYGDFSENCYMIMDSAYLVNCHHIKNSDHCTDSAYLEFCSGCKNCFGCQGLVNKEYYIFNEPYSKEEYEKFLPSLQDAFNQMGIVY